MSDDAMPPQGEIILYQTEDGRTRLECRFSNETLWLSQALIADLFQVSVPTVNEHLKNLYDEGELTPDPTIRKFRIVRREGTREVAREIEHYNLDASHGVEEAFANQLERNEAVKVYAKLPGWFKVPTPLGTYNPDWAVLVDKDGTERLYFVVETKSSLFTDDLRDKESAKIRCGEAHFAELANHNSPAAQFIKVAKLDDVLNRC